MLIEGTLEAHISQSGLFKSEQSVDQTCVLLLDVVLPLNLHELEFRLAFQKLRDEWARSVCLAFDTHNAFDHPLVVLTQQ